MKTPEQMMQFIVEQTPGECWHEWEWIPGGGRQCKNCDIDLYYKDSVTYNQRIPTPDNPSHTDLNELMRLAGKLGFEEIRVDLSGVVEIIDWGGVDGSTVRRFFSDANTVSEALLKTMYKACGGVE